jgi:hypothetical protein
VYFGVYWRINMKKAKSLMETILKAQSDISMRSLDGSLKLVCKYDFIKKLTEELEKYVRFDSSLHDPYTPNQIPYWINGMPVEIENNMSVDFVIMPIKHI